MNKPIISIITINRNNSQGLKKTMQSVFSQEKINSKDLEYIVIDGASTDGSVSVIKDFFSNSEHSNLITYWCSEKDSGIYNAMNKGIKKAKGDYLLFLNSGDYLYCNNTIHESIPYLCNHDIISGELLFSDGDIHMPPSSISAFDLMDSYISHPSTFISRKLFSKELYSEKYKIISDYVFFFNQLIFNNCSYSPIKNIITVFDNTGLSCTYGDLMVSEKQHFFSTSIPEYVLYEYDNFKKLKDSNIIKYGTIVTKNRFLSLLVRAINKIKHYL